MPRPAVVAELCCCFAAAALYHGQYGHPAVCALPLLLLVVIMMEYPPPGRGVGQPAAPLAKLKRITGTLPLGEGGVLEAGCAYTIIFWRGTRPGQKVLGKLERLWRHCEAATSDAKGGSMKFVIVSDDPRKQLQQLAKKWETQLTIPIAHDESGEASKAYVTRHQVLVLPQVFVVGPEGHINWHGHATNRGMTPAIVNVTKQLVAGRDAMAASLVATQNTSAPAISTTASAAKAVERVNAKNSKVNKSD